ncbi:MAG: TRAP transporter small permease [Desulfobacteraceae bacterium]|nr:TRAP transporter small permease [Desulfobacteraceae bacterium]
MKLFKKIEAIIERITDILAYIAGACLAYIVVSVTLDVVFRYFLNNPLPYTIDISEILLLFITFLSAAWVMKREGHVRMDFIVASLKESHRFFIYGINSIIAAIISLILFWYGSVVVLDLYSRNIVKGLMLELPQAPIISVIPLSFLFLFFQCIKNCFKYFHQWDYLRKSN